MGYASQSGRAKTSPRHPRAFAVCDRCGIWYNHHRLNWQFQWTGSKLTRLNILVCRTCLDKLQPQLKARVLPPDPVPISNPRPEWFANNEVDYLAKDPGGSGRVTKDPAGSGRIIDD